MPMLGLEMTEIEYATERVSGKFEKVLIAVNDSSTSFYQNGVPYNLSFTLHATTNHLAEMDQITEQILPFFSPHVVTRVGLDDTDLTWDMKVILESAGIEQDVDIEQDMTRKIH